METNEWRALHGASSSSPHGHYGKNFHHGSSTNIGLPPKQRAHRGHGNQKQGRRYPRRNSLPPVNHYNYQVDPTIKNQDSSRAVDDHVPNCAHHRGSFVQEYKDTAAYGRSNPKRRNDFDRRRANNKKKKTFKARHGNGPPRKVQPGTRAPKTRSSPSKSNRPFTKLPDVAKPVSLYTDRDFYRACIKLADIEPSIGKIARNIDQIKYRARCCQCLTSAVTHNAISSNGVTNIMKSVFYAQNLESTTVTNLDEIEQYCYALWA